jgi:hypothetical protein
MRWNFALRNAISIFVIGSWSMRRRRAVNSRKPPPILGFMQQIAVMPDEELNIVYADYAFLAAVDQNPEFREKCDACLQEIKWRASLPPVDRSTCARTTRKQG